jgi:acetolactate synthase-1/2/3 large subunit
VSRAQYGSDLIVDVLRALGIQYAALNPGATFRGLHDSLVNYGGNTRPELILCCHEEIAVAVAHGYAKATGRPMAVLLHDVVGLQHASMAIFNAWCDHVPILLLGGTGPMAVERRRPWIDWIHTALVQGTLVRDYVKWDDQPGSLPSIPEALVRGYRIAMTEPRGPVYVCLDADLQEAPLAEEIPLPPLARLAPPHPPQADGAVLDRVAALLRAARHPVILAGETGRNPAAISSLVELADLAAAPVVDLYAHGRFNFPSTHPLDLTGAREDLLKDADLVLALDVPDLHGALSRVDRLSRESVPLLGDSATVVHIALWDAAVRSWVTRDSRLTPVDVPVLADSVVALPALVARLREHPPESRARHERYRHLQAAHDALRREARERCEARWNERPPSPPRVAAELWEALRREEWVLTNGTLGGWARALWEWTRPDQYLGHSGGAGLGYGAGASVGAALAHRGTGKLCVDLQADGDLLYTPSALWTAAHHRIPLLVVVCNNRTYHNDEVHQELVARARGRPVENKVIGIRIDDPPVDFAGLARSLGAYGDGPIEDPAALGPALRRAVEVVKGEQRPALVDVLIQPE